MTTFLLTHSKGLVGVLNHGNGLWVYSSDYEAIEADRPPTKARSATAIVSRDLPDFLRFLLPAETPEVLAVVGAEGLDSDCAMLRRFPQPPDGPWQLKAIP